MAIDISQPAPCTSAPPLQEAVRLQVVRGTDCLNACAAWAEQAAAFAVENPSCDPRWLHALAAGLGHRPYCITAHKGERLCGLLPLAEISSLLFGKHIVGLPYVSTGGIQATSGDVATQLADTAVQLADERGVRHLQLRHEMPVEHPALVSGVASKVHMRLALPTDAELLWKAFNAKVRNHIRKSQNQSFSVEWGTEALLNDFYAVFSQNMRDLGTPVFSRRLFLAMLQHLPTELCVVREGRLPIAAGVVLHGPRMSQVLSASSLRSHNARCPNMLLYWNLLVRSCERGQATFDFGRTTINSNTYRFKAQWGAQPVPTAWQFYVRRGQPGDMRPEQSGFRLATKVWQRLPLPLTRWIGPSIIRGIPT